MRYPNKVTASGSDDLRWRNKANGAKLQRKEFGNELIKMWKYSYLKQN